MNAPRVDIYTASNQELDRLATRPKAGAHRGLPLTYFDDAGTFPAKDHIIKGVLARRETSSWIAPPGKGKSALLTSIAINVAAGSDWRGYRNKGSCGVLFFAFERADLVLRRLEAHKRREGHKCLPIAVADQVVNMMEVSCVDMIVDTIASARSHFGCEVGLAIFDTFAKGIAAGGGDEDKARDQNAVLANLRRVQSRTGVHTAIIGHTGKDETRGARGSNAHLGDVDVMMQIKGDDVKTVEVTKANDAPEGVLTRFRLETFQLGIDDDGDPITTAIISEDEADAGEKPGSTARKRLTARQANCLEALSETLLNVGVPAPAAFRLPDGIKVAPVSDWREEIDRRGIIDPEVKNPRGAWYDLRNSLTAQSLIGIRDELVWRV